MRKGQPLSADDAQALAINALAFIAAEADRFGRFAAFTGIGPADIRRAAREPGFLSGLLDYIANDEALLMAFAADAGVDPAAIARALAALRAGRRVPAGN
ncbi:MAG: DUF3572 domain-containing protein [Proteobacteria bacterium]|nr:DUF3572 domain-containing protein [Pseudomonadota bacterium]